MPFSTNIQNYATRVATESKALRTLLNGNAVNLASLNTTAKNNVVAALNELHDELDTLASAGGAVINDASTSSLTQTYSVTKIRDYVATAIAAVTAGAPAALDTLDELAAALGDDANFASVVTAALGNRVRHDTPTQGLNDTAKANARANIGAFGAAEIGDPDIDLVAIFEAGLI